MLYFTTDPDSGNTSAVISLAVISAALLVTTIISTTLFGIVIYKYCLKSTELQVIKATRGSRCRENETNLPIFRSTYRINEPSDAQEHGSEGESDTYDNITARESSAYEEFPADYDNISTSKARKASDPYTAMSVTSSHEYQSLSTSGH